MQASPATARLHQWEISPFCGKVRKILTRKGIAFETIDYNGLKATGAAKLSTSGKLPVLDLGETRVQDSSAIAAFLEQACPDPPLLPASARDQAQARIVEDWADESLYFYEIYLRVHDPVAFDRAVDLLCAGRPGWERAVFKPVLRRKLSSKLNAQGLGLVPYDQVEAQFFKIIEDLDAMLADQDWLVGDRETLADIAVSSQIEEVLRTSPLRDRILGFANLAAWIDRGRTG